MGEGGGKAEHHSARHPMTEGRSYFFSAEAWRCDPTLVWKRLDMDIACNLHAAGAGFAAPAVGARQLSHCNMQSDADGARQLSYFSCRTSAVVLQLSASALVGSLPTPSTEDESDGEDGGGGGGTSPQATIGGAPDKRGSLPSFVVLVCEHADLLPTHKRRTLMNTFFTSVFRSTLFVIALTNISSPTALGFHWSRPFFKTSMRALRRPIVTGAATGALG